jgi:hypothetical protein
MLAPPGSSRQTTITEIYRLQNKVLRTIGHFPRHTPVRDLHMAFKLPYKYDYITKLCRQQTEGIQIIKMQMFPILDKANPDTGNIKSL